MTDDDPFTHSIYCGLRTKRSPAWIAKSLARIGWDSRMCSWTEHELTSDHAELVLIPADPPLLSGGIRPEDASLHFVLSSLRSINVDGDYELYDGSNELIGQGKIGDGSAENG